MENKTSQPSSKSIKTIQRRLILILVRAFLTVAVVGMVALMAFTFYEISSNTGRNPFYKAPNATILEAFYVGRGSWEGVDVMVNQGNSPDSRLLRLDWERSILLDQDGNVVLYYGTHYPSMPKHMFEIPPDAEQIKLFVGTRFVGTLLTKKQNLPHPVRLTIGALNPVFLVALLLTLLTVVIGVLLMRRVVNPLSEVIAAAESVSAGNLGTRIEIKKSQGDLNALGLHFNKMTETLERNDNERRALLADIAHELRTPLSVMRGRLEGIMDGVYPANETNIAQALEETYLLERLVEDLRLLTMAETRQLHFELKETDLVELFKKTITIFEPQAKAKKVDISFEYDEEPVTALVDPQRMEQVMGNLIENSLRYMSANGKIIISVKTLEKNISCSVSDTGPGVNETDLPYIFDRFWRGEKSRSRVSGGAGLGLAISKQLIEGQGGTISAANRPGGGLEIIIRLPLR